MNKVSILILFLLMVLLFIPFIPNSVFGGILNSTYNNFNVTSVTRFNWTTSLIYIGAYNNTTTVNINNETTGLYPNYTQYSGVISYYTSEEWAACFPGSTSHYNVSFKVQRGDGSYTNFTSSLNESDVENFTLSIHTFCPPGLYSGYIILTNVSSPSNSSDNISVPATVNIPISANNTFDMNNNRANFTGTMAINDTYHSYYFNTSEITENTTGLTMKLTVNNDDVDVFVLNSSGVLKGKSIEKSTSPEQIIDLSLPSNPDMWEIRVYGNVSTSSTYWGYLYFSTLNISNSSGEINSLYFGDLDPNSTNNRTYNLTNEDNRNLSNVYDYFEIYHVDSWYLKNTSQDVTNFLVPTFATKIKVMINWTVEAGKNITDWDLYLTDSSGNLIGSSTDKFVNSNKTNVTREEFVVFSGLFNSSNEGFWNISVRNQTNSTIPLSYYDIIAYVWMTGSNWISTNFTDGFDFNSTGSNNDSFVVGLNLTIPETQVLNGRFESFAKYNSSEGWNTKLPISLNVSAGTLVINNTLNTSTIRLKDNIGFNKLGSGALTLNVTFNNTGSYPIHYTNLTSNYTLTKDSNSNISFTVDGWPSSPINTGTKGTINITISINTTLTGNDGGIYKGWIFFNTTNTTLNSSSYPYKTFNLSLEVNLTNELVVQLESVNTSDGDQEIENSSTKENVTFVTRVYFVNGTQFLADSWTDPLSLHVQNFTARTFAETNYTSESYSLTNVTQETVGDGWLCKAADDKCYVNATTPKGMIGGRYRASIGVQYNTSESILIGNGSYDSAVVNNTGFVMSTNYTGCSWGSSCSPSFSMNNGTNRNFFVNVTNYGSVSVSTSLNYSENCAGYSVSSTSGGQSCPGASTSGTTGWTITPAAYSTSCLVWWKITAGSSNASACSGTIVNGTGSWFNPNGITVSITVSATTTTTTAATTTTGGDGDGGSGDGDGDEDEDGGEPVYLEITTSPSTVSIEQGKNSTESVIVKNVNESEWQTVTLSVTGINSSWYDIAIKNKQIDPLQSYSFFITFLIPDNATVKDYASTFKASSSLDTVSKSFTLEVTPGPELQEDINITLSDYESQISTLETQINQSRDEGHNTTVAESKLSELKDKFEQALEYRDTNDYKSAYELFDEIDVLLNETRTELEEAGLPSGGWWRWVRWVIVAVVGVVALFLGYLFWPTTTGFEPGKKFIIKTKREVVKDGLSDQYRKLKEKWSKIREKEEEKKQEQSVPKGESQ